MSLLRLFWVSVCALFASSCSDIAAVQTGELSLRPEMVTFRSITLTENTVSAQVEIRNVGLGRLPISGVRVEEDDDRVEIFIVDVDDLQSERFIEPDGIEVIELEWTPVDANPDRGRLIVTEGDGSETAIVLQTAV